ncbi:MAG: guanylate kinase [Clostridiales bacterium]|jgi:guanylate kinase|nr:guanylate kinase [Clostridiales bacterium]
MLTTQENSENSKGLLFIITGASGVGKSTVYNAILDSMPNLHKSISMTTRTPRTGEIDGVDYYFIGLKKFEQLVANGQFLEYAKVHSNFYGTPKDLVLQNLMQNKHTVLEIDVYGAMQVKEQYLQAVWIFITLPNMDELKQRLKMRNLDSEETINLRMLNANDEFKKGQAADYIVQNDNLCDCIEQVQLIIESEIKKRSQE